MQPPANPARGTDTQPPTNPARGTGTVTREVDEAVTAAMVVIGDEILSGRTKDRNVGFVAETMALVGIDLEEVRIVPDRQEAIVEAVNALRARHTYVFTSGGIGPTHDDITADAVSAAFGRECIYDPRAVDILAKAYGARDIVFTDARKRMARMPEGAELIENSVSSAPGFRVENVFVMAGVPKIMQAMMDAVVPTLRKGRPMVAETVECALPEGLLGQPLGEVQDAHPGTMIGSYPQWNDGRFRTQIVVRGRERADVEKALAAVREMVRELGG